MSWKAVGWAKTWRGELTSPQAFVLFLIAEHYNDKERRAWPAISTLADQTRLDRRTVQRAIDELAKPDRGLVEREPWWNERRRTLATRYCLPLYDSRSVPQAGGRWVRQSYGPTGEWETEDVDEKPLASHEEEELAHLVSWMQRNAVMPSAVPAALAREGWDADCVFVAMSLLRRSSRAVS